MYNKHFDPFNLFIDQESRTILVLNPKVMTTTLRSIIKEGLGEFRSGRDSSNGRYKWWSKARDFPIYYPQTYLNFHELSKYECFSIVRHPFLRAWSAWKDKFYEPHLKGGAQHQYPRSMRQGVLRDFRQFAKREGLDGSRAGELVPYKTFLQRIASQKTGRRNHHWDTQTSVIQLHQFQFSRIYKYESDREEFFQQVFSRIGFDEDWVLERVQNKLNFSPSLDNSFDEAEIQQMRVIYRDDLENFSYPIEV